MSARQTNQQTDWSTNGHTWPREADIWWTWIIMPARKKERKVERWMVTWRNVRETELQRNEMGARHYGRKGKWCSEPEIKPEKKWKKKVMNRYNEGKKNRGRTRCGWAGAGISLAIFSSTKEDRERWLPTDGPIICSQIVMSRWRDLLSSDHWNCHSIMYYLGLFVLAEKKTGHWTGLLLLMKSDSARRL